MLFESAAICLHLSELHPSGQLIPPIGNADRALLYQWMMNLTNSLQAELMVYFYPKKNCHSADASAEIISAQQGIIEQSLSLLNDQLAKNELYDEAYLLGNSITACDYFYLFCLSGRMKLKTHHLVFLI